MSTAVSSPSQSACYYCFGCFRLDPQSRILTKDGLRVSVTAKALEVLLLLVERAGETLTKAELREAVWGSSAVEENNLNQCVSAIRKALREHPGEHQYILTVTGVGYRFIAPVSKQSSTAVASVAASRNRRPIPLAVVACLAIAALVSGWIAKRHAPRPRTLASVESLPKNPQALELYLEARRISRQRLPSNLDRAIELFQRAAQKDPNFALAYAGLSEMYAIKVANGLASPETLRTGEAAATKALTLDPTLAEVHSALGLLKYSRWDWRGAEREYTVALRLDPANARALMRSAMVSFVMGRFKEAESRLHRAQLLEPSNGAIAGMLCELYYYWRRYDDCIRQADRIVQQFDPVYATLAWLRKTVALIQERRFSEAAIAAQNYAKSSSPDDPNAQTLELWLQTRGDQIEFEPRYQRILETHRGLYLSPYGLAAMYAGIGDKEMSFRHLEIAYRQRITDLVSVKWDPMFDCLRNDPRYFNLLTRMGLSGRN